jgi:hypothetical protein
MTPAPLVVGYGSFVIRSLPHNEHVSVGGIPKLRYHGVVPGRILHTPVQGILTIPLE